MCVGGSGERCAAKRRVCSRAPMAVATACGQRSRGMAEQMGSLTSEVVGARGAPIDSPPPQSWLRCEKYSEQP